MAGCSGQSDSSASVPEQEAGGSVTQTEESPAQQAGGFPASVIQNLMNACVAAGSPQSTCECYAGEVEKRFTLQEFSKLELSIKSGQQDDAGMTKLSEAQAACI